MAPPYAWNGFFVHPLIGYQTAEFTGGGGRLLKNANGFTLGGEGGYNFQFGRVVLGPVADLSYSFMQGSANSWLANVSKVDVDWVGSARAQAGYTFDRFMIYGTGGVAFATPKSTACSPRTAGRSPAGPPAAACNTCGATAPSCTSSIVGSSCRTRTSPRFPCISGKSAWR